MRITYVQGDLLDHPGRYIAQGCNARGDMNSGVAKAIRAKYPEVYTVYRAAYEAKGLSLGQVVTVDTGDKVIFNAITQQTYGKDGAKYVSDQAIRESFLEIHRQFREHLSLSETAKIENQRITVAIPLIGAGLGGGDWIEIQEYLGNMKDMAIDLLVYINEPEQYRKILADVKKFDDDRLFW